jgi:hypothetical protein
VAPSGDVASLGTKRESCLHAVAIALTRAGIDEVDEAALRQARERLADDAHVAALLAAGDPAAERAALALAINAGSWSRALVGLSQAVLHLERHVSRGLLRRS